MAQAQPVFHVPKGFPLRQEHVYLPKMYRLAREQMPSVLLYCHCSFICSTFQIKSIQFKSIQVTVFRRLLFKPQSPTSHSPQLILIHYTAIDNPCRKDLCDTARTTNLARLQEHGTRREIAQ